MLSGSSTISEYEQHQAIKWKSRFFLTDLNRRPWFDFFFEAFSRLNSRCWRFPNDTSSVLAFYITRSISPVVTWNCYKVLTQKLDHVLIIDLANYNRHFSFSLFRQPSGYYDGGYFVSSVFCKLRIKYIIFLYI